MGSNILTVIFLYPMSYDDDDDSYIYEMIHIIKHLIYIQITYTCASL